MAPENEVILLATAHLVHIIVSIAGAWVGVRLWRGLRSCEIMSTTTKAAVVVAVLGSVVSTVFYCIQSAVVIIDFCFKLKILSGGASILYCLIITAGWVFVSEFPVGAITVLGVERMVALCRAEPAQNCRTTASLGLSFLFVRAMILCTTVFFRPKDHKIEICDTPSIITGHMGTYIAIVGCHFVQFVVLVVATIIVRLRSRYFLAGYNQGQAYFSLTSRLALDRSIRVSMVLSVSTMLSFVLYPLPLAWINLGPVFVAKDVSATLEAALSTASFHVPITVMTTSNLLNIRRLLKIRPPPAENEICGATEAAMRFQELNEMWDMKNNTASSAKKGGRRRSEHRL